MGDTDRRDIGSQRRSRDQRAYPAGEKLELDACLDSFRQAEQFWKEKQVYLCHSWLYIRGSKKL